MHDPTTDPGDRHSGYFDAMRDLDQALDDALSAIRAEQDAGRITPAEAAAERVGLLERHLAEVQRLHRERQLDPEQFRRLGQRVRGVIHRPGTAGTSAPPAR